jgi:hypothetical protein
VMPIGTKSLKAAGSSNVDVDRADGRANRAGAHAMSALPPKADMCDAAMNVRFGPEADSCSAAKGSLFDHLIGAAEERHRNGQT